MTTAVGIAELARSNPKYTTPAFEQLGKRVARRWIELVLAASQPASDALLDVGGLV
jgi:hypothetical protein